MPVPIAYEKYYVEKFLAGYISPYRDPFQYRSIHEVGLDIFETTLDLILSDTRSRDLQGKTGKGEMTRLIELAENEFNPKTWNLAYLGVDPIGLILPQRFPDSPKEGTLFVIGVVPGFRRRGYAKIIHAKGLQTLASLGIDRYVGSTDIGNLAMIGVFSENNCNYLGIRQLDIMGNHISWRDRPKK